MKWDLSTNLANYGANDLGHHLAVIFSIFLWFAPLKGQVFGPSHFPVIAQSSPHQDFGREDVAFKLDVRPKRNRDFYSHMYYLWIPIGSMYAIYGLPFTINIPQSC